MSSNRILVVDDDHVARHIYRDVLELGGFVVEMAADGREALDMIAVRRPDLIVLDILMPLLDGWSVLAKLSESPDPPPTIVVSASADLARALEAGACAVFSKPFVLRELQQKCGLLLAAEEERRRPSSAS